MNKQYKKWFGDVELTKELLILLTIGGCYSLSVALSNTFVNIYLWKQSGKFMDLAIYNLMVVIFQPLTFIIAGKWAKKVDRIMVLRMGVSFLALFYLSVLFFGERAHEFLAILGALLGVGYGFYWLAYNVLTFEITEPETRDFFNGFLGTLSSAGGMVGPVLAGSIISRFESFVGYSIIFAVSLGLFTIAVLLSLMLKRRPAHGQYFLKRIWKERKTNQNWNRITIAHFFQGLREGVFVFVILYLWVGELRNFFNWLFFSFASDQTGISEASDTGCRCGPILVPFFDCVSSHFPETFDLCKHDCHRVSLSTCSVYFDYL
ncbi:MFS transporter [Bacillus smithii]|uniref:MFS transporter n=1 Tax=Bacillus smithii TaxID=1479 RepID=UPI000B0404C8